MNRFLIYIFLIIGLPLISFGQKVTYSDFEREDTRDINFEIIGKMNGNFLVYKNAKWRHKITVLNDSMRIKESIKLDFIPDKTFNVDFVIYPDFFYMIYQYQKKNILYCMGVKMDGYGKKMSEPVQLDTTQISILADNKIYTTVFSEDKQKIMVFKIHRKNEDFNIVTLLFNNNLKMIAKTRQRLNYEERKDNFSNFMVDNDGNFVFTKDSKSGLRDNSNLLHLAILEPEKDTFSFHNINMDKTYIDEVKLKIDNLNKRYIINSFYYKKSRGNIDGLFTYVWDKVNAKTITQSFNVLNDTVRYEAKATGQLRFALDDYFIRQVFTKKDGSFLLTAEDFSSQSRNINNPWNRWDYLNNYYYYSPYSNYYYYNPYSGFYRPFNSFGNQSTRYYYARIMILSIDKNGKLDWHKIIHKDQTDEENDNFLSFSTMNSGGEIHFLFNDDKNRNQIIANHSITPGGQLTRNPTLKSQEKGYQFMPKLSKQVGASQLIIPCIYRGYVCFAKVDF